MLEEQGIQVARRTVAKYREALKIAPANRCAKGDGVPRPDLPAPSAAGVEEWLADRQSRAALPAAGAPITSTLLDKSARVAAGRRSANAACLMAASAAAQC